MPTRFWQTLPPRHPWCAPASTRVGNTKPDQTVRLGTTRLARDRRRAGVLEIRPAQVRRRTRSVSHRFCNAAAWTCAAALLISFDAPVAHARPDTWQPGSVKTKTTSTDSGKDSKTLWKLPSLPKPKLPKLSWPVGKSASRSKGLFLPDKSTWHKVTRGAKSLGTKTKSVLWPWGDEPSTSKSSTTHRKPLWSRPAKSKSTSDKSRWWSRPFGSTKSKTGEIKSVNDFLKLPTVKPD